jgi:hypothetical protein
VDSDINNRLKTLFDALRVPKKQEIQKSWAPTTDERPLHCLLYDDQWITRVNVETAQLLEPVVDSFRAQLGPLGTEVSDSRAL